MRKVRLVTSLLGGAVAIVTLAGLTSCLHMSGHASDPLNENSPSPEAGLRTTSKYWSPDLAGVWARSPYLHNGSVRTLEQLLAPASERPAVFHRGSNIYDEKSMGYLDEGRYVIDANTPANSNRGHEYGTKLTPDQKHDLIEFLKTL